MYTPREKQQGLRGPFRIYVNTADYARDVYPGWATLEVPEVEASAGGSSAHVYQAYQGANKFAARFLPAEIGGRNRLVAEALASAWNHPSVRPLIPPGMSLPVLERLAHATFVDSADSSFRLADIDILPWADGGTLFTALYQQPKPVQQQQVTKVVQTAFAVATIQLLADHASVFGLDFILPNFLFHGGQIRFGTMTVWPRVGTSLGT
eukprot:TRINITY_DN11587_c0_g1_i1.p1 TRINITY_DN11587_c0_g1~~TRINITY_DN11587_c0_g1_i1.p1  ORF type:complete len:208 (+),score=37.14 TRINITY_DN11587_c0_g1_i1:51-674(+)